jgi:hypothetical protein
VATRQNDSFWVAKHHECQWIHLSCYHTIVRYIEVSFQIFFHRSPSQFSENLKKKKLYPVSKKAISPYQFCGSFFANFFLRVFDYVYDSSSCLSFVPFYVVFGVFRVSNSVFARCSFAVRWYENKTARDLHDIFREKTASKNTGSRRRFWLTRDTLARGVLGLSLSRHGASRRTVLRRPKLTTSFAFDRGTSRND